MLSFSLVLLTLAAAYCFVAIRTKRRERFDQMGDKAQSELEIERENERRGEDQA